MSEQVTLQDWTAFNNRGNKLLTYKLTFLKINPFTLLDELHFPFVLDNWAYK